MNNNVTIYILTLFSLVYVLIFVHHYLCRQLKNKEVEEEKSLRKNILLNDEIYRLFEQIVINNNGKIILQDDNNIIDFIQIFLNGFSFSQGNYVIIGVNANVPLEIIKTIYKNFNNIEEFNNEIIREIVKVKLQNDNFFFSMGENVSLTILKIKHMMNMARSLLNKVDNIDFIINSYKKEEIILRNLYEHTKYPDEKEVIWNQIKTIFNENMKDILHLKKLDFNKNMPPNL